MEISGKIRKMRELKGFSQDYMALKLKMSQNNYSKLELGKSKVDINQLERISEILEVDLIKLIEFDENIIFNNNNQSGGNFAQTINQELSEKLIAMYEEKIRNLERIISELRAVN